MKIVHVANFYGPTSGGLRTAMHNLGAGYLSRGHEFLMIVPGTEDADEVTPYGRRITVKSPVLPRSGGYRVIIRTGHVRDILEHYSPDVLEVSDRTTLRSLAQWASPRDIRSVFISHERADGILFSNIPRWLHWAVPIRALANWHNRTTARMYDTVVCTTDYAGEEFDRIGYPTARIPLGVDLETFGPEHYNAKKRASWCAPEEELLVMASRLSQEKNPHLAIDAARILAERGRKMHLVSVGTGAIAEQVHAHAEGAPVTFLGFISDKEIYRSLLATADVIVAPGPIETFGLAALEGLASGTPAVVNSRSALPEVIGSAGAAAEPTAEGFADAIEKVLAMNATTRRIKARARAEEFPWSATVDGFLALHSQDGS